MGAEISRGLEEEAARGVQGVVAVEGLGPGPGYRRAAADVATRHGLFAFCADWDLRRLSDFLRWHARYVDGRRAARGSGDGLPVEDDDAVLDPRALEHQVDALTVTAAATERLLEDIERELAIVDAAGEGPEAELQRGDLELRRQALATELRATRHRLADRAAHLLARIDDLPLMQAVVEWPAYLWAITRVHADADIEAQAAAVATRHPATWGFAMRRDADAPGALAEYNQGDVLLPPPAAHEIDGHTDDSASSSAASDDGGGDGHGGEEDDDEDDVEKDSAEKNEAQATSSADVAGNGPRAQVRGELGAEEDNEEDDDDDDEDDGREEEGGHGQVKDLAIVGTPSPTSAIAGPSSSQQDSAAPRLTPETLQSHTTQHVSTAARIPYREVVKRPRVMKRPLPSSFDGSLRSPVFFGYSTERQADALEVATSERSDADKREAAIFEAKIKYRREQLEAVLQSERGKLNVIQNKTIELREKRERYWEKRTAELERAKKELDPADIFFRTRDVQDKKTRDTEAYQDEEMRRQRVNIEGRIKVTEEEFEKGMEQIRLVRSTNKPLGDVRLRFHEKEADQYQNAMVEAKKALEEAKEEYVALKSTRTIGIGNSHEAKNRAQMLFAEDQIRAKERELEAIAVMYEDELFLLKRAHEVFEREQLFLPLFSQLQRGINGDSSFTLLELAFAILLGLGRVSVEEKIKFVFNMFSRSVIPQGSHQSGSTDRVSLIRLLQRNGFAEVFRLTLSILARLGDVHPQRDLDREAFLAIADREFLRLNVVVECDDPASSRNGLTMTEFTDYCTGVVHQSKYLSELLGAPWICERFSRFVLQHMSATHQYKLGLLNINDLKYAIARQAISSRQELSRWRKLIIHERALAMGENDPLKTDYSKYLPKRRSKLLSKVVPLDHGGYRNLLHYRMEVILRATVKLQTVWRARKGRQFARLAAEKQAFYHARGVALREARDRVESEWREKDAKPAHTVEKMKFEAKIRMKQVKLRTKGNALSREQVLTLLMEEAVQQAQREVENRFREMEEELGYLRHDDSLHKPHDDVAYLHDVIAKALVAQVVEAKQEHPEVGAVMDSIALKDEISKRKKSNGVVVNGNQENHSPSVTPPVIGLSNQESDHHLMNPSDRERRVKQTEMRQNHMVFGRFPQELYVSGMTRQEELFCSEMAFPDPELLSLQSRLKQVCVGMTDFKLHEFLQELPSKRHICSYTLAFRRFDGTYDLDSMEQDLYDHFRMVRGPRELAEAIANMSESDLEFGLSRQLLSSVTKGNDHILESLVTRESNQIAKGNLELATKKLARMGYRSIGDEVPETNPDSPSSAPANPMAVLEQKEQHDHQERLKRALDAQSRFIEAMRTWKEAELALHEAQRSQNRVIADSCPVRPVHRSSWSERFQFARQLPEKDVLEIRGKYTELLNIGQDFLDTATAIAVVLIREYPLPRSQKSILPLRESTIDGRRDSIRSVTRLKFEAHNILFTVCTDDHGRFEQSDEFAAKFAGHEIRNSALFLRALLEQKNVIMPLQCVVDYHGFRVLCSTKVPVDIITWNESGTSVQKISRQQVYGTENRGQTIVFQSQELDQILADAASHLNLSRHGVRGYHDLTSKLVHGPADMLGYVTAKREFALLRFARAMPPEDPEMTPHLCASTRGMTIMWRQLRPELVRLFTAPLSPDALSSMTYCTPDWQSQALGVENATKHLIEEIIPAFARKLSQQANYFSASSFCLTSELHRHGINVRHLGILRSQFPFELSGTATLQYATAEIQTTEDFTREIERGAPLLIEGKAYFVSKSKKHRHDDQCITLHETYTGSSVQNVKVFSGRQDCKLQAAAIRNRILAEMVARTLKNNLRHLLRTSAKNTGTGLTALLKAQIVVGGLNLLTGSMAGSATFWYKYVYEGIRSRFGRRAVSEVDRQNMRRTLFPHMHLIVSRVAEMMGFTIRLECLERIMAQPDSATVVLEDLDLSKDFVRVKHNLSILHFSMASLLLLQATLKQATTYRDLVVSDKPGGYWPLCERRGLCTATNLGIYGKELSGRYLPGCLLEADGPIVNAEINRSTRFCKESRSYVGFLQIPRLYPPSSSTHVTIEAWCKCEGHASTRRVVLTLGRYSLTALKSNVWAFTFCIRNIDIVASGGSVVLHQWVHLVGTYDGTMLRLFVNGLLMSEVDVEDVVDREIQKREAVFAKTRQDILDLEEEAKGKCYLDVDREMQQFFASKDGKKQIKAASQKLLDEHEFRVRLSKATTMDVDKDECTTALKGSASPKKSGNTATTPTNSATVKRDFSKVSRSDFEALAKKQILREKYEARVKVVVAEFEEMRKNVNTKIDKEIEEQSTSDSRELRIGCLSSARRRDGKYFFHGCIAHVAYFNGKALDRDQINAHYVLGVHDRAHESDNLFALAASRFDRALKYAPDDLKILEKFAENICASLKYDLSHKHAQEMYKKKVKCGLQPFITTENVHGIAEILKNLPRDPAFRELFVLCYHAVLRIQPEYFQAAETDNCRLSLQTLARLPFAFFLGSKAATSLLSMSEHEDVDVPVFADIICKVLKEFPTFYGDQLTNMGWLRELKNPKAIVYFILSLESGEDSRYISLESVSEISPADMDVIVKHNRFALGFALVKCSAVVDVVILRLVQNCSQVEQLDVSYCSQLTDTALAAIGKYCQRVKRLWLVHCHQITDVGVEAAVRTNSKLEELGLSFCERVSDRCIGTVGKSCPNLTTLELEFCVQIGSAAMKAYASTQSQPSKLRRLHIGGCRRVTDDGLVEIARKCTKLQYVNLNLCDKVTDTSVRVLTHNCLELEELLLEEVCLASYKMFLFDQAGDGRGVVDKNLLKKLRRLSLIGCAGMNDLALGHVGHRAKGIESIQLSSCAEITDQGLTWLTEDMLDKSPSGTELEEIDVSYCPQLSAVGIHQFVAHCPKLTSLNLSGCIHLSDEEILDIVNSCNQLVRLEVGFCRHLTDRAVSGIAKHLSLERLSLGRCVKITDAGVCELAGQSVVLRALNISACKKLTDHSLLAILDGCPLLEELEITHCPHFSPEVVARFHRRKVRVICAQVEELAMGQSLVRAGVVAADDDSSTGTEEDRAATRTDELGDPRAPRSQAQAATSPTPTGTTLPPIRR